MSTAANPIPAPRHCPPGRDCRSWAYVPSPNPDHPGSHREVDDEVQAAWKALSSWLEATAHALKDSKGLMELVLPNPNAGRTPFDTGLIDVDLLHVVVAAGQRAGEEVDALYVGLVAQEPSARWIGLSGFFLPVCSQCDRGGVGRATDRVLGLLDTHGFTELPGSGVPEGLRPGPGWFDRQRLQTVARRTTTSRHSTWCAWPPPDQADDATAILVRVAPVVTSLSGLVLCNTVQDALDLPAVLGKTPGAWTWTAGELTALTQAVRHRPRRPREVARRSLALHDWWASDEPLGRGAPRRINRGPAPSGDRVDGHQRTRYWALTGSGVATSTELMTLLTPPRQST